MLSRRKLLALALTAAAGTGAPRFATAQQDAAPADQAAPTQAPADANQAPADLSTGPAAPAAGKKQEFGEEIVVTGSRVRRKELTTPAPVAVINREQIMASGALSIGDFLQSMPEQGNGINTTVNNGGDGSTQISLRSLGAQRTLVLIDGKRFISGVPGNGNLNDPGTDLNSIPAGAVERIEVLKDGASAIYGSDAIGGVVNIITRKRFSSVEGAVNYGASQHGDANTADVNVLGGATGDRGSFSFGAGYFKQSSLFADARDWARVAQGYDFTTGVESPQGSSAIPAGRATIDPSTCNTTLCKNLAAAYGPGAKNFLPVPAGSPSTGSRPVVSDGNGNFWRQYNAATDTYNFQAVNYLITPSQRISLYSNGDYNISDNARAYFHGTYVNRQSSNLLAPVPMFIGLGPPFPDTVSATNAFNPFGVDINDARRRFVEGSGRSQGQTIDTFHTFAGIDGTLPEQAGPLARWFYDISFGYARNNASFTTNGSLNTQLIGQAIGPSTTLNGAPVCADASGNPIAGCTPANLFGGPGGNPMTPAMVQSLGAFTGVNQGANQVASFETNLNGELFKLGADTPASLAVGYTYRAEYGFFTFNPVAVAGNDSDYSGSNTSGRFHVNEGYAELSLPFLSGQKGVDYLEGTAAVRVSDYSSFGTTATYKFGARYRPIRDFTVRGTYATGFRAPGITALYGGTTPNAEASTDPCANTAGNAALTQQCNAQLKRGGGTNGANNGDDRTQITSTSGGNPLLQPEKSQGFTIGAVIEPRQVKNLSLTVDFFNINIDQNIAQIGTPTILAGCYPGAAGTPNQAYCDLILRGANGKINDVTDVLTNVGSEKTQGLDVAARYVLPTTIGRWGFTAQSTFLFLHDVTLANGTVIKGKGTYDLTAGAGGNPVNPAYKFNLGVQYAQGGFAAAVLGRFIGGYHECADATLAGGPSQSGGSGLCYLNPINPDTGQPFPVHNVSFYDVYDVNAQYTARLGVGSTTIGLGVRNLLNKDPPRVYNSAGQTNSDPTTYDYVGRFLYARLVQTF
ncbi:MAG TPA: TonB-dependent receptor [Anaeromyxobacteraceae bacterium]|nr:TonB-dependent receptor [Anaeromyxobacteraceae bacterium]